MTTNAAQGNLAAVEIAKLEGQMKTGFAQLSGKLDTLIAKQVAAAESRALDRDTADKRHGDHEERLRSLEDRKTVSPLGLWSVVLGAIGAVAGIVAIVSYIN